MATMEDFKKIELVVAQIKEVKEHPNADRLYVLQVDTGRMCGRSLPGSVKRIPRNNLLIAGSS